MRAVDVSSNTTVVLAELVIKQASNMKYGSQYTVASFKSLNSFKFIFNVLKAASHRASLFVDLKVLNEREVTDLKNRTGSSIYCWETEANGGHIGVTT